MIPTDLATRLKSLLDLPLPQVTGVSPTRSPSPDLSSGQRFTAQIAQPLPDGTYRALVAGRSLTLSLPQSVKNGDVLELVVTHATPQAVYARLLEPAAQDPQKPTLSVTARLISQLLTGRESAETPAALNEGNPLLPRPPQSGAQLAPLLQRAVAESGMFYEAHQAQWVDGKLSTAQLLAEPQAKLTSPPPPQTPSSPVTPSATAAALQTPETTRATNQASLSAASQQADAAERNDLATNVTRSSGGSADEKAVISQLVPRDLAPLVLNQLDALATQQLTWQGQIWPGQNMQWSIEQPPDDARGRGASEDETEWRSTLRVTLPSLGGVEARMYLTAAGIAVRFVATDDAAVARLNAALPALGDALDAAGIPLTGAAVSRETPA